MISVVVPVYNVASYLPQCLDSLISQTYMDLEIIVVNDGSTDDSPSICDNYAAKDKRVKVIHKINGGLSDARNVGIKQAIGEWIYFADSDDWLDITALSKLYEFAITNNCDIVQGNFYYIYPDRFLYRKESRTERNKNILTREEAMRLLIINDRIKNFAWGKLYKTRIVKDLKFPEGKYYEDCFWQHFVIDKIDRYGIIDIPLYNYRQRKGSLSSDSRNSKDLLDGYASRFTFIKEKYPIYQSLMEKKYLELEKQIFHPQKTYFFNRIISWILSLKKFKSVRI